MDTMNEVELLCLCILSSVALFWGLYQVFPLLMRHCAILRAKKRIRRLQQKRDDICKQWDTGV